MKICFVSYTADETIPVAKYLRNRKLRKYFSRETSVAVVCAAQLLEGESLPPNTPFYYAVGLLAYEEYGLPKLVENSLTDDGRFSTERTRGDGSVILSITYLRGRAVLAPFGGMNNGTTQL